MDKTNEKIGVLIERFDNAFDEINKIPLICYHVCDLINMGCNHIYIAYKDDLDLDFYFNHNPYRMLLNLDKDEEESKNFKIELLPLCNQNKNETKYFYDLFKEKKVLFYFARPSILIGNWSYLKNINDGVYKIDISNVIGFNELKLNDDGDKAYVEKELINFETNYFCSFGNIEFEAFMNGFLSKEEIMSRYN